MRITSKGQVTIPQAVRNRLGLLPHTEVEFEIAHDHARLRKAGHPRRSSRGNALVNALRGTARGGFSTDEIMLLTRDIQPPRRRG